MKSRNRLLAMAVSFTGLLLWASSARAQDCSNPPRGFGSSWWREYSSWCTACGGAPYNDSSGMGCKPGPNWGRRRDSNPPAEKPPGEDKEEARRKEAEERDRKERERKEEEARRAEEEKERFKREQRELLDNLKGVQGESSDLKGEQGDLKVKPGNAYFGIPGNPSAESGLKEIKSSNVRTAWQQLYCSAYISDRAARSALKADFYEATYLIDQTGHVMGDGKAEVTCPPAPEPPQPYGRARLSQPPPLVRLYKLLIEMTERDVSLLAQLQQRFPDLHREKQARHQKVVEKKMELEQIKQRPVNLKNQQAVKQKSSNMAEVLAALKAAHEAEAEVDKGIKDQSDATNDLIQVRDIFGKVQAKPELAQELLNQLQGTRPLPKR